MSSSSSGCVHHDDRPAIAVCTRCDGDICAVCHDHDLRGFAVCKPCRRQLLPSPIPWEDEDSDRSLLWRFVQTAFDALRGPRQFFSRFRFGDGWAPAALFGVLCITLGSIVHTLWQKAFSASYAEQLQQVQAEVGLSQAVIELFFFATIPVVAVTLFFLHTALFFGMLRVFRVEQLTWTKTARITGYAMAAHLMFVFPPIGEFSLGHFLMIIWLFNLEVGAIRRHFGLGFWKSIGVVILPLLVFLFTLG